MCAQRPPCVHFIGFRGDEYWSAVRIWGRPDFFHRDWDFRAAKEIAAGDVAIFAKWGADELPHWRSFNDAQVM